MEYKGYQIDRERDHIIVTDPEGLSWEEDSVQDAKLTIDGELKEKS